jgi:hypothetical protein
MHQRVEFLDCTVAKNAPRNDETGEYCTPE